jgi:hypothetical protein
MLRIPASLRQSIKLVKAVNANGSLEMRLIGLL